MEEFEIDVNNDPDYIGTIALQLQSLKQKLRHPLHLSIADAYGAIYVFREKEEGASLKCLFQTRATESPPKPPFCMLISDRDGHAVVARFKLHSQR